MLTDVPPGARSPSRAKRPGCPNPGVPVPLEDPVSRAFMLFVLTGSAASKYADTRFFQAHRLSMAKFLVLLALAMKGGKTTHSVLADWTNTRRHNITTLVDRMEKEQFVATRRSRRDRRSVDVVLTERGRHAFGLAMPVARGIIRDLLRGMTQEDALGLETHLKRIGANIEGRDPSGNPRPPGSSGHKTSQPVLAP